MNLCFSLDSQNCLPLQIHEMTKDDVSRKMFDFFCARKGEIPICAIIDDALDGGIQMQFCVEIEKNRIFMIFVILIKLVLISYLSLM